jgi:hypothetical protein
MDDELRKELDLLKLNQRNHTNALYIVASALEETTKRQMLALSKLGLTTHAELLAAPLHVIQGLMAQLNQMKIRGD